MSQPEQDPERPSDISATQRETSEPASDPRTGSPFRGEPDPVEVTAVSSAEPPEPLDIGPGRTTALGAVWASALILTFATASAWWFPGGGLVVATLGSVLAIFGLASPRMKTSLMCLAAHVGLFLYCFVSVNSTA